MPHVPSFGFIGASTWYWTSNTVVNCVAVADVDGDGFKKRLQEAATMMVREPWLNLWYGAVLAPLLNI